MCIAITHENPIITTVHIRYFVFLASALATAAWSTLNDTSIDTMLVVLHLQEMRIGITEAPFGVNVTGSEDNRGTHTVATHFSVWRQ
jgi:hypothetical protein